MQIAQKNFYKKFFGRSGEKRAAEYLKKEGYEILEKNYKTHVGEADIICAKDDYVVFVEVKTRVNDEFGAPSEAVDLKKQRKYVKVAEEYLLRNEKWDAPCRFDVIEIEDGKINHIENAFSA